MLVDPFVVAAQIVNFAILVWLLKRFLYGPVTRAMAAREARVRAVMEEARALRTAAEAEGERYRSLLADFDAEREARLREVHVEVEALRQSEVREARAEVKEQRVRWHHALEQEKEAFLRDLRTRVGREGLAALRRAFEDLADEGLEDRVVARFLDRLASMSREDRSLLGSAARAGGTPTRSEGAGFHVATAFPLTEAHRAALTRALATTFDIDTPPRFDVNSELVAGVEVRAGGVKAVWTVDDYLRTFEEVLREVFPGTDGPVVRDGTS